MIDRYTLSLDVVNLAKVLQMEIPEEYVPQFNAAPTKLLPLITNKLKNKLQFFNWGLMSKWSNNRPMSSKYFNVSLEAVLHKPGFKNKILNSRCIIPMDGFYMWKPIGTKKNTPYYCCYPNRQIFWVAGIWEEDQSNNTFMLMTKESNEQISNFQIDMPLIMSDEDAKRWIEDIDIEQIKDILYTRQHNEKFNCYTVSPRILYLEINRSSLIDPTPALDQYGNYTLFS